MHKVNRGNKAQMLRDIVQSHGGLGLRYSVSFPGKELGDAPRTALGVLAFSHGLLKNTIATFAFLLFS